MKTNLLSLTQHFTFLFSESSNIVANIGLGDLPVLPHQSQVSLSASKYIAITVPGTACHSLILQVVRGVSQMVGMDIAQRYHQDIDLEHGEILQVVTGKIAC